MSAMELKIWEGDWGLPSVDLFCLQVMAYAKFSGAPLKLLKTNNPLFTPNGQLPVFCHSAQKIKLTKFQDIVEYFRQQNYTADMGLTAMQCSEIVAYGALLKQKLYPALLHTWWVDARNCNEVIKPWFVSHLPLPLRYILPGHFQRSAAQTICSLLGFNDLEETQLETLVLKNAQECLTHLSHKLGNNEFFFGRSPTSMDAIVFAYLAPLLHAPLPNASLQNYLKACVNLSRFVVRIIHRYFPLSSGEAESQRRRKKAEETSDSTDFPHKWRNIILWGMFASLAMASYALYSGIIQVEFHDADDSETEAENVIGDKKMGKEDYQ